MHVLRERSRDLTDPALYPEVSGIGTSSAEICLRPVDPLLASRSARPAAALRDLVSLLNAFLRKHVGTCFDFVVEVVEHSQTGGNPRRNRRIFFEPTRIAFPAERSVFLTAKIIAGFGTPAMLIYEVMACFLVVVAAAAAASSAAEAS